MEGEARISGTEPSARAIVTLPATRRPDGAPVINSVFKIRRFTRNHSGSLPGDLEAAPVRVL